MTSPGSPRNDLINIMCYLFRKSDCPCTCLLLLPMNDRGGNTHQRSIGTVQAQRVVYQIEFAPEFAGHDPAVRLVPVKDELFIQILADDIQVNGDLSPIIERHFVNAGLFWLPARGRHTILGGVNAGASPLAAEVADVQRDHTL